MHASVSTLFCRGLSYAPRFGDLSVRRCCVGAGVGGAVLRVELSQFSVLGQRESFHVDSLLFSLYIRSASKTARERERERESSTSRLQGFGVQGFGSKGMGSSELESLSLARQRLSEVLVYGGILAMVPNKLKSKRPMDSESDATS